MNINAMIATLEMNDIFREYTIFPLLHTASRNPLEEFLNQARTTIHILPFHTADSYTTLIGIINALSLFPPCLDASNFHVNEPRLGPQGS
jgi:hypothetical protein